MPRTLKIPIDAKVLQNVDETVLQDESATLENAYVNDRGGISRFPQLASFVDLPGDGKVYMDEQHGDMVAVSGGRTYRVAEDGTTEDVTKATVRGRGRVSFAHTERELLMAAGGPIVRLAEDKTNILSKDAPETTHVGFLPSGYVVAIEPRSGRFQYSEVGQYDVWNPLNVLSASGKADNLNALLISEFGELFLAGPKSIEQFDEAASGTTPFFRRWFLGAGLYAPDTFLSVDNRIWGVNSEKEWVAFSAQLGRIESDDIQVRLEEIIDWDGAWATEIPIKGHRFMLLQIPKGINRYGTEGITFLFDYRKRRWSQLFGWDDKNALPSRWAGWSYKQVWDRHFVGGEGKIYELTGTTKADHRQRVLWRSGHISRDNEYDMRVNAVHLRVKRGTAAVGQTNSPLVSIRVNKNNRGWSRWVRGSLGAAGEREMRLRFPAMGVASSWQFEIMAIDDGPIEIAKANMEVDYLD